MSTFPGFPKKTITYLKNLSKYNNRDWFQAHRDDYEEFWLEPAQDFVVAAGKELKKLDKGIHAEPRVNGSIFRINRDIRFSKDKTPYKDHLDLWFWEGERKVAVSGYFFRLTGSILGLGAGAHGFDSERLAAYRGAVTDSKNGAALKRAATAVGKEGWDVKGEHYKTVPRGFEVSGAVTERLIRHNALWVGEDVKTPPEVFTPAIVDYCVARWRTAAPIHRWLTRVMG